MILLQFILVHYGFLIVAQKYGVQDRVRKFSQSIAKRSPKLGKFLYEVSECKFCITHHIGALLIPFLVMGNGFAFVYLLYPLMSAGAIFLIEKKDE